MKWQIISRYTDINILATRLFVQQSVNLTIKKTSKFHITSPLWRETTGDRWVPLTKSPLCGKRSHIMTLLCYSYFLPAISSALPTGTEVILMRAGTGLVLYDGSWTVWVYLPPLCSIDCIGPRLSIEQSFHHKDKTFWIPSYLYNANSYIGKTTSLYSDGPCNIETLILYVRSGFQEMRKRENT